MKVSAVITTYNRRTHIFRAIESVLAQTTQADEIIVVDDGSTDGTSEAIRVRYGSRVSVVSQNYMGVSAARSRGVREAKGEWIAFLDSDDEWLPGRNCAFLAAASALPEMVAWIVGDSSLVTDDGEISTVFGDAGFKIDSSPRVIKDALSLQYPNFMCFLQSSFIRREALVERRCFSEGLRDSEDVLAAVQVASKYSFGAIGTLVTRRYRTSDLRQSSLMNRSRSHSLEDHCLARVMAYSLATEFAGRVPWVGLYEDMVWELCKARADKGLSIRRLALDEFRFGISANAISCFCLAMLGRGFVRTSVAAKSKLRRLIKQ